jgi:hypothetical protein
LDRLSLVVSLSAMRDLVSISIILRHGIPRWSSSLIETFFDLKTIL